MTAGQSPTSCGSMAASLAHTQHMLAQIPAPPPALIAVRMNRPPALRLKRRPVRIRQQPGAPQRASSLAASRGSRPATLSPPSLLRAPRSSSLAPLSHVISEGTATTQRAPAISLSPVGGMLSARRRFRQGPAALLLRPRLSLQMARQARSVASFSRSWGEERTPRRQATLSCHHPGRLSWAGLAPSCP